MPSEPVLAVKNVSKAFPLFANPLHRLTHILTGGRRSCPRWHHALRDISFLLNPGECLGVMGRNGAGKTTLLGLLAGSIQPTTGSIQRPKRIGTLIQLGAGFDPEATGWSNVSLWSALDPDGPFTPTERAWIADFTELGEALDRPVRGYSQGMQLRLGFAVATARRPDLLVIDEVMAVGDFFFRRKCHERISLFVREGTAAILVSHDYTEILDFCDRALLLHNGIVQSYGDARDVVAEYLHGSSIPAQAENANRNLTSIPDTKRGISEAESALGQLPIHDPLNWPSTPEAHFLLLRIRKITLQQ